MKIAFFQPPGRFPTVVPDLGLCWENLCAEGADCFVFNANIRWWRSICSPSYISLISERCRLQELLSGKLSPNATPDTAKKLAVRAGDSLLAMSDKANYFDSGRYAAAVKPFSDYVRLLNFLQPEFRVAVRSGPEVDGLDYSSSAALADLARKDTLLTASVEAALEGFPADADACLFYVTSPQDLLTALISARLLRRRTPGIYLSLLSHSHENFSLERSAEAIAKNGEVFGLVDSIVRFGYQKDDAALYLARSLASGVRPAGFIEGVCAQAPAAAARAPQPLAEVFAPAPVFWMRLSPKRCYWGRCSFCIQNNKHQGGQLPSASDMDAALGRISALNAVGYDYFYFWDEAVAPELLERFCVGIEKAGMRFRWGCRCRIDAGYTREFFSRLKAAGCYEILFGIESVVPRVQRLMNKYERDMEEGEIRTIVSMAKSAGLNIHLTFLTRFPGEKPGETAATVNFAQSVLCDAHLATYYFNVFKLYPGSEVFNNPGKYGITFEPPTGDIPAPCAYSFADEDARTEDARVRADLPDLLRAAESELGWARLDAKPEYRLCREFYFNYGHGSYIKAAGADILKALREGVR